MMRFNSILLGLVFFSATAQGNGWETVVPIGGELKSLRLRYNAQTIRAILDKHCSEVRVACVAAVPANQLERQKYGEQWYQQCLEALEEANNVGNQASWQIYDWKKDGNDWLVEPSDFIGVEIICETKPQIVPAPPMTPPIDPHKAKVKMVEPPPLSQAIKSLPAMVAREQSIRSRETVELMVAVFGESWYALARGELDGLGAGAAGIEVKLTDALLMCLRAEVGSSQRGGTPYLWLGGLTDVSAPLWEMVELGGFVRWHIGLLGPEPSRNRVSAGVRVVITRLVADNLGLEVLLGAARDLTPGYEVKNGKYTEANDLTVGLAVGALWLPFL